MQPATVTVVGSFMMDFVVRTERRPGPGETVIGLDFGIFPGGKGLNQAVTARRMGARVFMVGRVGQDSFGDTFLATLEAEGIATSHVIRDPGAGTGVAVPVVDGSGENAIVVIPRANMRVTPADVASARPALAAAAVVLLQNEIAYAANLAAARLARDLGKLIIYNPAPARGGVEDLLALADVVTPNEVELQALTGIAEPGEASRALIKRGTAAVVATLGSAGCLVADANGHLPVPAFPVAAVDTTGAGNAFNGALAVALAEGLPLRVAAAVANAAGALAATRAGAVPAIPTRSAVQRLVPLLGHLP